MSRRSDKFDNPTLELFQAFGVDMERMTLAQSREILDNLESWYDKYLPTDGALMVAQERARQMYTEGYTLEHDESHEPMIVRGSPTSHIPPLVRAAISYLAPSVAVSMWPWPWRSFKSIERTGDTRNLEKAAALAAAEIDRVRRVNGDDS